MLADPPPPRYLSEKHDIDVSPSLEPGIYRVSTRERLSEGALFDALEGARFVIVGERHDDVFHHAVQQKVYAALVARALERQGVVLLGMEMVQAPYQQGLDRYVAGELDEAQMLEAVEWSSRWGYPAAFYAPMWRLAREHGAGVVGLNAPRELSRKISKVGLEGLSPQERALLPERLDLDDEAHRQWFAQMFLAHGAMSVQDQEAFERFYQAQVSWDETMAHRAWEAMQTRSAKDQMVIVAGAGHVMRGWGIPSRIVRRLETPDASEQVVTLLPVSAQGAQTDLLAPTGATEEELEAWSTNEHADYIWVE